MHKIDSFLRETQRVDSLNGCPLDYPSRTSVTDALLPFSVSLGRLALRPFTFSNGVTVPAGTLIVAPAGAIHRDGEIFPNPEEFDGFRFAKLREHDGGAAARCQALSTSPENLTFGYGRHAWCVFFFCLDPSRSLIFLYQPRTVLCGQRSQGFTCTHRCNVRYQIRGGQTGPTQPSRWYDAHPGEGRRDVPEAPKVKCCRA